MDNYEYELPSDFEDEEVDEEMAFTAEDKKLYAGWFGDEEADQEAASGGASDEDDGQQQRRSKRSKLGEFADLESSSEEEQEGDDDDDEVCPAWYHCCSQSILMVHMDKWVEAGSRKSHCISQVQHVTAETQHVHHMRQVSCAQQ